MENTILIICKYALIYFFVVLGGWLAIRLWVSMAFRMFYFEKFKYTLLVKTMTGGSAVMKQFEKEVMDFVKRQKNMPKV